MRRMLGLLALAAVVAGCGADADEPAALPDEGAAPPQRAVLDWRENYGAPGARLVFRVTSLAVEQDGWRADVAVRNESKASFSVATGSASLDNSFGLMLLPTGDLDELERLNRAGELPAVRQAERFDPPLPGMLEPGAEWRGTIAARGSLPAGTWARVVFGSFAAVDETPPGLEDYVIWITDHAHRLEAEPAAQPTSVRNPGSSARAAKSVSPAAMAR